MSRPSDVGFTFGPWREVLASTAKKEQFDARSRHATHQAQEDARNEDILNLFKTAGFVPKAQGGLSGSMTAVFNVG